MALKTAPTMYDHMLANQLPPSDHKPAYVHCWWMKCHN